MAATAAGGPAGYNYTGNPAYFSSRQMAVDRTGAGFRAPFIAHLLYFLGGLLWIIGAALHIGSQPRFFLSSNTAPFPKTGGLLTAGTILFIIASATWILAGIIHVIAASSEVRALRAVMGDRMAMVPSLARYINFWAWFTLLGSCIVLIGSAIFLGEGFNDLSAGSILWLIGFFFWGVGSFYAFALALMALSVTPMMWDMRQRYRAWKGAHAALVLLVSTIFFQLGALVWIAIRPPGLSLLASLLFLVAAITFTLSQLIYMHMRWHYHVPFLTLLVAESPEVMLARMLGAGAVAGAPMLAAGAAGGATAAKAVETQQASMVTTTTAAPAMTAAAAPGVAAPGGVQVTV